VEIDVVGQDEYLLDVTSSGPHFVKESFDQASNNEQNIAI
jgi:hypothetical protein